MTFKHLTTAKLGTAILYSLQLHVLEKTVVVYFNFKCLWHYCTDFNEVKANENYLQDTLHLGNMANYSQQLKNKLLPL